MRPRIRRCRAYLAAGESEEERDVACDSRVRGRVHRQDAPLIRRRLGAHGAGLIIPGPIPVPGPYIIPG